MQYIRERIRKKDFLAGTWNSTGSSVATEITGLLGYDWVLIDQEHAPGDSFTLIHQIMALKGSPCAAIVRIAWNDRVLVKKALDLGAAGLMFPTIETADEARQAVDLMRYPPIGSRGVAGAARAAKYGTAFKTYQHDANEQLACIVQIETGSGVANAESIAAVEGVDVLFVGPVDLSFSVDKRTQFADPEFVALLQQVGEAGKKYNKSVGILVPDATHFALLKSLGFTFIAVSSEQAVMVKHMGANLASIRETFLPE